MRWICSIIVLLSVFLNALPLWAQEQAAKSKIVSDLSAEVVNAVGEPRDRAQHELSADYAAYETPDIATSLADPLSFIAIVTMTGVKPLDGNAPPYRLVKLHVDQLLRGASEETELQAVSRWVPPRAPDDARLTWGGPRGTIFDYAEPKVGNRYLIGYPRSTDGSGSVAIFGAIDLGDHDQSQIISDVQHFLDIESAAGSSNFAPHLGALSDRIPWIRDLSAHRLVQSDACNASPACQEAFLSTTESLLHSKRLGERWEALQWTEPLALAMGDLKGGSNGLPTMSDAAVRKLLVSALSDPNLWLADEAFRQIELFDFFHSSGPRECIGIFPSIRKSVRWTEGEMEGESITGTVACTPEQSRAVGE
jgi:hypothetical protein